MNGFLFQFQSALEEVFDGWMDVFQNGVEEEMLEITCIVLRERAGEVSMLLKCGDIHEVGADARADLFAKLREDIKAAVIQVGPKINRFLFGDEVKKVADGGGGVPHEADYGVVCVSCCLLRGTCSVVYLCTCVPVYLLVKGSEVFDAEDGVGADVDSLNVGDLRRGKANRWREGIKVDDLSIDVGQFPVSREMDVCGVCNEVEFAQEVFVVERFPFSVGAAGEADESRLQIVKAFGVIEDAHAEDAVGSLGCQCG